MCIPHSSKDRLEVQDTSTIAVREHHLVEPSSHSTRLAGVADDIRLMYNENTKILRTQCISLFTVWRQ